MTAELDTIRAFLAGDNGALARQIVDRNPWFCDQVGVDLGVWAPTFLATQGLVDATIHIVGSAATGFSLKEEQPGRPFRFIGDGVKPSDLDVAIVHQPLFDDCWAEMVVFDRTTRVHSEFQDRVDVYWGHLDDYRLPERAQMRRRLRDVAGAIQRSAEFRGYPCTLRIYRSRRDLVGYVKNSINDLERSLTP